MVDRYLPNGGGGGGGGGLYNNGIWAKQFLTKLVCTMCMIFRNSSEPGMRAGVH